jgi:hypothetical protein
VRQRAGISQRRPGQRGVARGGRRAVGDARAQRFRIEAVPVGAGDRLIERARLVLAAPGQRPVARFVKALRRLIGRDAAQFGRRLRVGRILHAAAREGGEGRRDPEFRCHDCSAPTSRFARQRAWAPLYPRESTNSRLILA